MTNEKAIMRLEDMKIKVPIPKAAKQARENNEALDVAIKALAESEHGTNLAEVGTDCISRQAAINVCERVSNDKLHSADGNLGAEECREGIKKLPPIQPKRGHWIEADVCGGTTSWECSCCHNWTGLPTGWNVKAKLWFCPKCTADMREVTE